jgi:hypothetical protein
MRSSIGFQQTLALGIALLLLAVACNSCGNSSSKPAVNMAGTWTGQAVSTKRGTLSGTATVAQSGAGLGNNGTTTLTAAVGTIAISESGTTLTGTLTDSIKGINYSFSGTLSGGNITITGSAVPCGDQGTQSASITGTIASTSMQGNYTITSSSDCSFSGDAGTWTATKQ